MVASGFLFLVLRFLFWGFFVFCLGFPENHTL